MLYCHIVSSNQSVLRRNNDFSNCFCPPTAIEASSGADEYALLCAGQHGQLSELQRGELPEEAEEPGEAGVREDGGVGGHQVERRRRRAHPRQVRAAAADDLHVLVHRNMQLNKLYSCTVLSSLVVYSYYDIYMYMNILTFNMTKALHLVSGLKTGSGMVKYTNQLANQ